MNRKAEIGVGTLIIFIAMLLVAAVAAGVLIQTAGSLQEQSLATGQSARAQISTHARAIEVSASDGRNGNLTDFREIMKLSPGSDPLKLSQVIFTYNTKDRTSTLKYRGINSQCVKNNSVGYNTWMEEQLGELEVWSNITMDEWGGGVYFIGPGATESKGIGLDLDDDGIEDTVRICDPTEPTYNCPGSDGSFEFNLTTDGLIYVIPWNNNGTWANLTDGGTAFNFSHLAIGNYGWMTGRRDQAGAGGDYYITDLEAGVYLEVFETPLTLEEDYDDDGSDDILFVNATHLFLNLSSNYTVEVPLGVNLNTECAALNITDYTLSDGEGDTVGYLTIQAICAGNKTILESSNVELRPYDYAEGYFSVIYETEGTNHIQGNLQRGDVIRLCFESPGEITEDSLVRLNFIPKTGTATLTKFVTPDVISTNRVYLYP